MAEVAAVEEFVPLFILCLGPSDVKKYIVYGHTSRKFQLVGRFGAIGYNKIIRVEEDLFADSLLDARIPDSSRNPLYNGEACGFIVDSKEGSMVTRGEGFKLTSLSNEAALTFVYKKPPASQLWTLWNDRKAKVKYEDELPIQRPLSICSDNVQRSDFEHLFHETGEKTFWVEAFHEAVAQKSQYGQNLDTVTSMRGLSLVFIIFDELNTARMTLFAAESICEQLGLSILPILRIMRILASAFLQQRFKQRAEGLYRYILRKGESHLRPGDEFLLAVMNDLATSRGETIQTELKQGGNYSNARQDSGLWLDQAPQTDPNAFLGRIEELRQLDDWLSPRDRTLPQRVVSIIGMGGVGKTQLALAYARQHGRQYSSVFWLDAQDRLSLQQSIRTLSHSIFSNEETNTGDPRDEERQVQRVLRWLSETRNNRWLVIFDNYDDPALSDIHSSTGFDVREFFPFRAQGSILITSRSPISLTRRSLRLCKLNDVALQVAILSQRARRDLSHVDVQRLVSRLDGLPLALASAGTYIGKTGASCTTYLDLYDEWWNELHDSESSALLEYSDRTLSSTWTTSLNHVRRQDADAAELLKFFALLNNEDVWYELLRAGARDGPAWMGRVTTSRIRFDRAIKKLRDYSLVEVALGSHHVHPCVHDWLLGRFQLAPDISWFLTAVKCITESMLDETSLRYNEMSRRLVRHVQRLDQPQFYHLWQACCYEKVAMNACNSFGRMHRALNHFDKAEQMYLRALAGREKVFGAEHVLTLNTVGNLGRLYADQGKMVEAEQMYTRALAGQEKALGQDHISTLVTLGHLGRFYADQGKLAKAEQIYTLALARQEKVLGAEHTSTLSTMNGIGSLYHTQGKLDEAEQMYARALAGQEKVLGAEHTWTLLTVDNIGSLYYTQGKLEAAEQAFSRALAGKEKALGQDHTSTLATVGYLGRLYADQGKMVEAEQMYMRALAGQEKVLGAEHTLTLSTMNNIGGLYHTQGKLDEAEQMYARALAGREKVLGPNHTSTLATINCLGRLYADQGKIEEAVQMYRRAKVG